MKFIITDEIWMKLMILDRRKNDILDRYFLCP